MGCCLRWRAGHVGRARRRRLPTCPLAIALRASQAAFFSDPEGSSTSIFFGSGLAGFEWVRAQELRWPSLPGRLTDRCPSVSCSTRMNTP